MQKKPFIPAYLHPIFAGLLAMVACGMLFYEIALRLGPVSKSIVTDSYWDDSGQIDCQRFLRSTKIVWGMEAWQLQDKYQHEFDVCHDEIREQRSADYSAACGVWEKHYLGQKMGHWQLGVSMKVPEICVETLKSFAQSLDDRFQRVENMLLLAGEVANRDMISVSPRIERRSFIGNGEEIEAWAFAVIISGKKIYLRYSSKERAEVALRVLNDEIGE